LDYDYYNMAPG